MWNRYQELGRYVRRHQQQEPKRRFRVVAGLPVLAFVLALPCSILSGPRISSAHDSLNRFVRHDIVMRINRENIDVSIELTFYAEHATALRSALDANGDNSISHREAEQHFGTLRTPYLNNLAFYWKKQHLELIELFSPEVDLMEVTSPGSDPCSIRISCFARTPTDVNVGDHLILRDGLWPDFPATHTLKVVCEDGFEIKHMPESEADLDADDISDVSENLSAENFVLLCANVPLPASPNVAVESGFKQWGLFAFLGAITAVGAGFRFVYLKRSRENENHDVP